MADLQKLYIFYIGCFNAAKVIRAQYSNVKELLTECNRNVNIRGVTQKRAPNESEALNAINYFVFIQQSSGTKQTK